MLIRVIMPAVPLLVARGLLNLVQPFLGGGVHGALIDAREEGFLWYVFERAGVRENNINLVVHGVKPILDPPLDFFAGLFVGKPCQPPVEPVVFIDAVRAAAHKALMTVELIDPAVPRKHDARILLLHIRKVAVKFGELVAKRLRRAELMVAMNAKQRNRQLGQALLQLVVPRIADIVNASVAQNDQNIVRGGLLPCTELPDAGKIPVRIACDINHAILLFFTRRNHRPPGYVGKIPV